MSAPKKTVEFSPDARADFTDILLSTLAQWGLEQCDRYEAALLQGIATLGDFPEKGAHRDDLVPGYRAQPIEHHVAYDRIKGTSSKSFASCTSGQRPHINSAPDRARRSTET